MPKKKTELAIIGAGPAGLAAAVTAAQAGVDATLLDEYPRLGGQYLRGAHRRQTTPLTHTESRARKYLEQLSHAPVTLRTGTLVWGIEGKTLAIHGTNGCGELEAEAIIIATGGREKVLPFPGWTLPGVMTLGAAQILVKEHGVAPGRRVLVAGSGPLSLAVAAKLAQTPSVEVVGILEATCPWEWLIHAPALIGNFDRLIEGWGYLGTIIPHRIPYRFGHAVIQANGNDRVRDVVTARLDGDGTPLSATREHLAVDTVCLGFGFVPNIALAQLAGCRLAYRANGGGWVPDVNENLETSIPGIYAAGEVTGIAGAKAALVEGQIAGLAVARALGQLDDPTFRREVNPLRRQLKPLRRFETMLNTLFRAPAGLNAITTDETILCRCEEVTAGEVRVAVRSGANTLSDLKNWTHVGQGLCQGRTCGHLLARQLTLENGCNEQDAGLFRARPPIKPIPLSDLAEG
jgi:NADPH-dependent 2,4-dienoyl-CoA reductase/sulfur reductase-like enzyme/bacterioferritin-associated ferredoxin